MPPESFDSERHKKRRILSCALCQQRKVKCDRNFPCSTCVKSQAQCVPSTVGTRPRKPRFPERELINRITYYEALLRDNKIAFEPFRKNGPEARVSTATDKDVSEAVRSTSPPSPESLVSSPRTDEKKEQGKSPWITMRHQFHDDDDDSDSSNDGINEERMRTIWDSAIDSVDHLLLGFVGGQAQLSALHPTTVDLFRLWQTYLENVDPILKVTHAPTLQARMVEAASNLPNIDPNLEALMFGVYSMAITSLQEAACLSMFSVSKTELLSRYQLGCQQALQRAQFLRTDNRDCLTGFFLYLLSIRPNTIPMTLSSLLGIAVRIATRMGCQYEAELGRRTVFEAEMRRRLWWALVLFDDRVCELACSRSKTLDPSWDCKIPLNVNDQDLRPEMKEIPIGDSKFSEASLLLARCELADHLRFSQARIDLTNPAWNRFSSKDATSKLGHKGGMAAFLQHMEVKYLQNFSDEHPLHCMITWSTRTHVLKALLFEHNLSFLDPPRRQSDEERDLAANIAVKLLEHDGKIMSSPLTAKFRWWHELFFPMPAYYHLLHEIRTRPTGNGIELYWNTLDDSHNFWFAWSDGRFWLIFSKLILQAWESCVVAAQEQHKACLPQPSIVSDALVHKETYSGTTTDSTPENFSSLNTLPLALNSVMQDSEMLYDTFDPWAFAFPANTTTVPWFGAASMQPQW